MVLYPSHCAVLNNKIWLIILSIILYDLNNCSEVSIHHFDVVECSGARNIGLLWKLNYSIIGHNAVFWIVKYLTYYTRLDGQNKNLGFMNLPFPCPSFHLKFWSVCLEWAPCFKSNYQLIYFLLRFISRNSYIMLKS